MGLCFNQRMDFFWFFVSVKCVVDVVWPKLYINITNRLELCEVTNLFPRVYVLWKCWMVELTEMERWVAEYPKIGSNC